MIDLNDALPLRDRLPTPKASDTGESRHTADPASLWWTAIWTGGFRSTTPADSDQVLATDARAVDALAVLPRAARQRDEPSRDGGCVPFEAPVMRGHPALAQAAA